MRAEKRRRAGVRGPRRARGGGSGGRGGGRASSSAPRRGVGARKITNDDPGGGSAGRATRGTARAVRGRHEAGGGTHDDIERERELELVLSDDLDEGEPELLARLLRVRRRGGVASHRASRLARGRARPRRGDGGAREGGRHRRHRSGGSVACVRRVRRVRRLGVWRRRAIAPRASGARHPIRAARRGGPTAGAKRGDLIGPGRGDLKAGPFFRPRSSLEKLHGRSFRFHRRSHPDPKRTDLVRGDRQPVPSSGDNTTRYRGASR